MNENPENMTNKQLSSQPTRRTFLKRTAIGAIAFTVVDLIPVTGLAVSANTQDCTTYAGGDNTCSAYNHDDHCNSGATAGTPHDEDQSCGNAEPDEGCSRAATDQDNSCNVSGDSDQACAAGAGDSDQSCSVQAEQDQSCGMAGASGAKEGDENCGGGPTHDQDQACGAPVGNAGSWDRDENCNAPGDPDSRPLP